MNIYKSLTKILANSPNVKSYIISFVSGSISAFSFAPIYLNITSFVSFTVLILIIYKGNNLFKCGWFFGLGHFLFGIYWISISLLVDLSSFFWLLPFSLFLIPSCLAFYIALTTFLSGYLTKRFNFEKIQLVLILSIIWTAFEYLRSILFTGFPWNLIGYSLLPWQNISQIASIFGIYGLSFLSVIIYSSPAVFIIIRSGKINLNFNRYNICFVSFLLFILLLCYSFGEYRANNFQLTFKDSAIRIVQPSISQKEKLDNKKTLDENIKLSLSKKNDDIDYLIWSESAVPYILDNNQDRLLNMIKKAIPNDALLISGGLRARYKNDKIQKIWNSIFVINDNGKIIDFYDKMHLVPFGEYIPLRSIFPFLNKITPGTIDFSRGTEYKSMSLKDSDVFIPSICYEIIFHIKSLKNSNFIINLTNDGWFGNSSGPYQHLDKARIKAIEYGLPVVRVANNGISALIDPLGRIVIKMDLNFKGVTDINLVNKTEPTIYSKYSNKLLILIIFVIIVILICRIYTINCKKHILNSYK